jgi:hypothetical protein
MWIGDSKSGWRDGITKVMNGFTVILLSLGFVSIFTALIGIILNHWDASKISQGQQQDYVLFVFVHKPIYCIRAGFYFASFLFPVSLAMSLTSLVVDFKHFKRRYLCLCIIGLLLTLYVYAYHNPPPSLRWAGFSYFSDQSKWLPGRVIRWETPWGHLVVLNLPNHHMMPLAQKRPFPPVEKWCLKLVCAISSDGFWFPKTAVNGFKRR